MFINGALYPVELGEDWAERYGLEIREMPCMACGEPLMVDIPWATKELRGLKGQQCSCGETRVPFTYTYAN